MNEPQKLTPQETVELDNTAKNGGISPLSGQIDETTAPAELSDGQLEAAAGGIDVVTCPECGSTNAAIGPHGIICRNCRYGDSSVSGPRDLITSQYIDTCPECGSYQIVPVIAGILCLKCGCFRNY